MNKLWMTALVLGLAPLAAIAGESGGLTVDDAWVRALPPTQTNTAAYLVLGNTGSGAIEVTGASAAIAQSVEFHTTREIDGYMRMEQLPGLSLAPGATVSLTPGGTHLMLLDLSRMPAPGESVRVCLRTAAGEEICTEAPVRKSGGAQPPHEHHH